ncbi:hypothetical protein [Streptomyces sp. XH2]
MNEQPIRGFDPQISEHDVDELTLGDKTFNNADGSQYWESETT